MKKHILITFLITFWSLCCLGQIDVVLDINGDYKTVVDLPDSNANVYKATKAWIINRYVNPEEVIVADEKGELLKIRALRDESGSGTTSNPGFYYLITFEFKKGKYRVTFNITELFMTGQYAREWTYDVYFNNGSVRKMNERKVYRIKYMIDYILNEHYEAVAKKDTSSDDDW